MKYKHNTLFYTLLATLACVSHNADAGIRVGNLSRSNAQGYQQVNNMRYQNAPEYQVPVTDTVELPIPVADGALTQQIQSGNGGTTVMQLERCSMIYPNGEFEWSRPTVGRGVGGANTCTAVVEMRAIGAGPNGSDAILARANLAAGDNIVCNISEFSDATLQPAAGEIEFPADREPTMDDVVDVMNREQKQNAGIKIAAGAILGGLGGNIAGKNEPGSDSLLGGGKHKTQGTIIGALGGAALMAGNAYTGKVAGDTILSAGVNAAAGGVMGNMVATGDSVMRIEDCKLPDAAGTETTCLWGVLIEGEDIMTAGATYYYNTVNETTVECKSTGNANCSTSCEPVNLISIVLAAYNNETDKNKTLDQIASEGYQKIHNDPNQQYHMDETNGCKAMVPGGRGDNDIWTPIATAKKNSGKSQAAMIAFVDDTAFGRKRSDWNKLRGQIVPDRIYGRTGQGAAYVLEKQYDMNNFYPMYIDAEDGGIIDLGNKARLKSTLTGAGIGGAMGAFAGYQGAQSDVEQRWVTAVREYKDSLGKIYCATGSRFLSQYNDVVIIPNMSE